MAKLYYGNGSCTIEGSEIRGVQIHYKGAIKIEDKTSDAFVINHKNNGIMVFPIGEGTLNELFDYTGEFKITSVIVAGNVGQRVSTTIHRVIDYTELLNTNAEDMTTKSEDLSATYTYGGKVAKTTLNKPHINNQHTSNIDTSLHLENGEKYEGYFHIHLSDNSAMTGREHSEDSQDLYFNHGKPTKNPSSVPYGAIDQKQERQKDERRDRKIKKIRRKY